ncbi:MAG: type II toxin-antitoxin system VapC family toxin, partial [Chloroflexi bacterium]|nr:type II toxin-antitoxin system VapC family toxin [Chloroflexota bacterium]
MIVDSSAILAALFGEPDVERFVRAIAEASRCRMSTANFLEAAIVVEARAGIAGGLELDLFIERARIELVPASVEQAQAARSAWRRFGKGNH